MITFADYLRSFEIACDPGKLDYSLKDSEFCLFEGSVPLLTPGGNTFSHPSEQMTRLLVTELQLSFRDGFAGLSVPVLFAYSRDILESGVDPFTELWQKLLEQDPFVRIKTSGGLVIDPFKPDDPLFSFAFITLSGLIEAVNAFTAKVMSESSMEETEAHPFHELIKLSYSRLTIQMKAAVHALSSIHQSGIVMPLLLVNGGISQVEYAKGLISLKIQPDDQYINILAEVAGIQAYLGAGIDRVGGEKPTSSLIREGEGGAIEFKSTLRWDIRAGKTNPAIERSCLKTISAFLNSTGGSLLIGVRDDGSIEGIETDKFANEDKFLLHLWTLIRICLGREVSPYIRTRLDKQEDKTVCIVDCLPAGRPVFIRQPGFAEEMYIRVGPSSNALDISEALKYIADRFKDA
jgi:hypothetical protein